MNRGDPGLRFAAIVVAAGRGVRFGRPKQLALVAGRPLVAWSLEAFGSLAEVTDLIVASEAENLAALASLAARYAPRLAALVVRGGATRQQSVRNALAAVPERCTAVFVHDGARPLVRPGDVRAAMAVVRPGRGALLAEPVTDTIKVVAPGTQAVARTLERAQLWAAQTPQFAMLHELRQAHERAAREGFEGTDDAMLLERIGCEVHVVRPSGANFKVTLPGDELLAESILREREAALPAG